MAKASKSSTKSDSTLLSAALYLLQLLSLVGILASLAVFFTRKDKQTRFNAAQSLLLNVGTSVVAVILMITVVGALLLPLLGLAYLVAIVYCAYKTYNGEKIVLPVIGSMAESFA